MIKCGDESLLDMQSHIVLLLACVLAHLSHRLVHLPRLRHDEIYLVIILDVVTVGRSNLLVVYFFDLAVNEV
jgi:hypothetical protein